MSGLTASSSCKRCVSDPGPRLPIDFQRKRPKSQSVSDTLVSRSPNPLSEWNFDPDFSHFILPSHGLSDPTACDVEAFDFSAYNFNDPLQTLQAAGADSLGIYYRPAL